MRNRIIATVILLSFSIFSCSCFYIREIKPEVLASAKPGQYEIRKIETPTGETVEYSAEAGDVRNGHITGTGTLLIAVETVEVDSAGLEIISRPGLTPMNVKTQDGRTYGWVNKIKEQGDKSVLFIIKQGQGQIFSKAISFSEVEKAWVQKINLLNTLLALSPLIIFVIWIAAGRPLSMHIQL